MAIHDFLEVSGWTWLAGFVRSNGESSGTCLTVNQFAVLEMKLVGDYCTRQAHRSVINQSPQTFGADFGRLNERRAMMSFVMLGG